MGKSKSHKSRRTTPWDGDVDLTPTQAFFKQHYETHYEERHRLVVDWSCNRPATYCLFCGGYGQTLAKEDVRGISKPHQVRVNTYP